MNNHEKNEKSVNYNLKSDAVEKLVDAQNGEVPQYSQEELNKYRSKGKFQIPMTVKVLFIKAWFAGAVCYFFFWGLGSYLGGLLDLIFVLGVAMGMVTDLLVNNILRFIETYPGENRDWMLFSKKSMVSFVLNILFSFVIVICVYLIYNAINLAINAVMGTPGEVPLGVEPILFGLLCMGVDVLLLGIKRLLKSIISDAKEAARKGQST